MHDPKHHSWPSGHILFNWNLEQILHTPNPRPFPRFWAWGLDPLAMTRVPGPSPFIREFWAIRPPIFSTGCGPWDQLGPFWPNSNDSKRGQEGSSSAAKPQVDPRTTDWPQIPIDPNFPHGLWKPPDTICSGPERLPLNSSGDLSLS
ncbi:hypothetical protein O181_014571 [Austropuccinia psidii MF-1]|uniref:Uncharacterized protein n=1 Tax=Austropuccinia psidii MF-1 TaxID=1389203 RepID=A0A9Q3BYC6_9BASI|nr:hypothetical protein [Austropuccinia psidii MF-1]